MEKWESYIEREKWFDPGSNNLLILRPRIKLKDKYSFISVLIQKKDGMNLNETRSSIPEEKADDWKVR